MKVTVGTFNLDNLSRATSSTLKSLPSAIHMQVEDIDTLRQFNHKPVDPMAMSTA